jgi:hypothetical protein
MLGTRVAETILASARVRAPQKAGHMSASDPIKIYRNPLREGGRPHMAPRRDGNPDCWQTDVPVAARQAGGTPADAQAAQAAGLRAEITDDRQACALTDPLLGICADLSSSAGVTGEQSRRELSSSRATARAENAEVQVGWLAQPFSTCMLPSTTRSTSSATSFPDQPADLQTRSGSAMARRRHSRREVSLRPLPFQANARYRDKAL